MTPPSAHDLGMQIAGRVFPGMDTLLEREEQLAALVGLLVEER